MDSVIEVQRQTHEQVERLERALAGLLSQQTNQHNVNLANEHRAKDVLERITERVGTLAALYDDTDGSRRRETELLSVPAGAGPGEELTEFYVRLAKIKDYHHKYPDTPADPFAAELAGLLGRDQTQDDEEREDPISLLFSGEESYGRYLDLYTNHTQYINIKNIDKRVPYLQYIDLLLAAKDAPIHQNLPKAARKLKEFENYLSSLHSYLLSFMKRTQPLVDLDAQQQEASDEFEKLWEQGQITGWDEEVQKAPQDEVGIWCAACVKMYSKQTVYDAHLKSKKHLKSAAKMQDQDAPAAPANGDAPHAAPSRTVSKSHAPARLTALLAPLLHALHPTLLETKANVERRFSLTARERELELEAPTPAPAAPAANAANGQVDEEEEEERIYNPLKLPLGWDGKPIPYWLFKLHGLGVEYRCEICSDGVYMGRKNFDRHFQESRHAFGMRALGLPNTKHFHEITKIEDALALAEKLKQEGKKELFQNETMEELEDTDGNVYNRKTYEDLKKQGII